MRSQYSVAAFLVLLIALTGVRFAVMPASTPAQAKIYAQVGSTPAQRLLLGETIDINTADKEALEVLPLIGPKLAARIVEDRNINGPFASVYDLARVYGIGRATIERNLPYIAVK